MTKILFQREFGSEGFEVCLEFLANGTLHVVLAGEEPAVLDADATKELGAKIMANARNAQGESES